MTQKVWEIVPDRDIACRVHALDWERLESDLNAQASAVIEKLITPEECDARAALYSKDEIFRIHVVMARHGFVRGEVIYSRFPLPDMVSRFAS